MSFKTCPHCGRRLVDEYYSEETELDIEDRVLMLLQHVSPEYLEEALEVARDIIENSPTIPSAAGDSNSGILRSVYEWCDAFANSPLA